MRTRRCRPISRWGMACGWSLDCHQWDRPNPYTGDGPPQASRKLAAWNTNPNCLQLSTSDDVRVYFVVTSKKNFSHLKKQNKQVNFFSNHSKKILFCFKTVPHFILGVILLGLCCTPSCLPCFSDCVRYLWTDWIIETCNRFEHLPSCCRPRMRFEMDKAPLQHSHQHTHTVVSSNPTAHQHILSAAEGGLPTMVGHGRYIKNDPGNASIDRECRVSLEERDLWSKFQELTNEMIVTKNGR